MRPLALALLCKIVFAGFASCAAAPPLLPLGLPAVAWPPGNLYSPAAAELGRYLFFDVRLSSNGRVSCASCHQPQHGFSGGVPLSTGVSGKLEGRRTPTLINRAFGKLQFWDGRAPTLEDQVVIPISNPNEMGASADAAVQILRNVNGYAPLFQAAFGDPAIDFGRIAKAIATFERTIVSGDSPFDRFQAGDKNALTKAQKEGLAFFNGKGECAGRLHFVR